MFLPSTSSIHWSLCPNFIQVLSNPFVKICAGLVTQKIHGPSHVFLNAEQGDCSDLCASTRLSEKIFLTIPVNFYTGKEVSHHGDLVEKKTQTGKYLHSAVKSLVHCNYFVQSLGDTELLHSVFSNFTLYS